MAGKVTSSARCQSCGRRFAARVVTDSGGGQLLQCKCGAYVGSPTIKVKWRGQTLVVLYDDRGKRLQTVVHASRALDRIRNQIERNEFRPEYWKKRADNLLLWPAYLDRYLEAEAKRLLPEGKDSTLRAKKAIVKRLKAIGDKNLRDIQEGDIEDFLVSPVMERLAPKTKHTTLEELRRILRRAKRRGDIKRVPEVRAVSVPRQAIKYYTPDQMAAVLDQIPDRYRPVFDFISLYAARPGEAGGLCWDVVDVFNREFLFARTLSDRRLGRTTKNRSQDPMPIIAEFAEYLSRVPTGIGENPVFINPDADPRRNPKRFYQVDFLNRLWREAISETGLEPIPLKNIRHSTAMYLLNVKKLPDGMVRRILRHSSSGYLDAYSRHEVASIAEALAGRVVKLPAKKPSQN